MAKKPSPAAVHPIEDFPLQGLVEVVWTDSSALPHWTDLDTAKKDSHPVICRSVGFLVNDTPQEFRLVGTQSRVQDGSGVFHTLSIPARAVLHVRELAR